ncbi:hypothetical protein TWF718_009543 [Orbilia javanica]|uniref:Uncharacterized protein n=1 Tax=Orbilia javanica TaxID=47235 RepID=A0AAN8MSN0_9PEZI
MRLGPCDGLLEAGRYDDVLEKQITFVSSVETTGNPDEAGAWYEQTGFGSQARLRGFKAGLFVKLDFKQAAREASTGR